MQRVSQESIQRESVLSRMKPFHGTFSEEPLWKMVTRPFFVLANPIVLWACLTIALIQVWAVCLSLVIAQAFSGSPYFLSIAQQGYMSGGPAVGGFLGCIACGLMCDPLARFFTRKNKGIYEPEFRLPMLSVIPVISTVGYFLFGNLIEKSASPVGASAMYGLIFVSIQFAAVSIGTYVVDAFRDVSIEIFVMSMTVKNFVFFGFSRKYKKPSKQHSTYSYQILSMNGMLFRDQQP